MKVGQVVKISFYDHAQHLGGGRGLLLCHVIGKVGFVNRGYVQVKCWEVDGDGDESNTDSYSILKSAIVSIKRYK